MDPMDLGVAISPKHDMLVMLGIVGITQEDDVHPNMISWLVVWNSCGGPNPLPAVQLNFSDQGLTDHNCHGFLSDDVW